MESPERRTLGLPSQILSSVLAVVWVPVTEREVKFRFWFVGLSWA